MSYFVSKNETTNFFEELKRLPLANTANLANPHRQGARDSQGSQDSQGVRVARAEVEAELERVARAAGFKWRRLRDHRDGVRDDDLDWFADHWNTQAGRPLARPYLAAVAYRLGIDPEPLVAPAPAGRRQLMRGTKR